MQLESKEAFKAYKSLRDCIAYLVPYTRKMDSRGVRISVLK
jgi:hypothetical protein